MHNIFEPAGGFTKKNAGRSGVTLGVVALASRARAGSLRGALASQARTGSLLELGSEQMLERCLALRIRQACAHQLLVDARSIDSLRFLLIS